MPLSGDDDDVAVLFTMPDGSKAFIIGNASGTWILCVETICGMVAYWATINTKCG